MRGVEGATKLVDRFQFHTFEVFSGLSRTKVDPTLKKNQSAVAVVSELLFAASEGNVAESTVNYMIRIFSESYFAQEMKDRIIVTPEIGKHTYSYHPTEEFERDYLGLLYSDLLSCREA